MRAESPGRFASEAAALVRARPSATGALITLSGGLAEQARDVATAFAGSNLGVPCVIVAGAGVLSERGEIERSSAGAAIVFRGGRPEALTAEAKTADDAVVRLAARL